MATYPARVSGEVLVLWTKSWPGSRGESDPASVCLVDVLPLLAAPVAIANALGEWSIAERPSGGKGDGKETRHGDVPSLISRSLSAMG